MPQFRFFASVREAAGTGRAEVEGTSVGEMLDTACEQYGSAFADQVNTSRIWVNGEPADRATTVVASDEVAVLPPVSGG